MLSKGQGEGQCGREVRVRGIGSYILNFVEYYTKMADQLPGYQVFLILEKGASPPSTAVSHKGALKALSGSRLTGLMR